MRILQGLVMRSAVADAGEYVDGIVGSTLKVAQLTEKNYSFTLQLKVNDPIEVRVYKKFKIYYFFVIDDIVVASVEVNPNSYRVMGKNATEVKSIAVLDSYQGNGLATAMYAMLFQIYKCILGDDGQFVGDRKTWVRLSKLGKVSIVNVETGEVIAKDYKLKNEHDTTAWGNGGRKGEKGASGRGFKDELNTRCLLTDINTDTLILKTHKKGQRIGISK